MLTFFCELASADLTTTISESTLETLKEAQAAISLAMLDLSDERATFLAHLQRREIPFTAWLLLEHEEGYWLTADNAEQARRRYTELRRWLRQHGLKPISIGLDVEPPLADSHDLLREGRRALWRLLAKRRSREALTAAQRSYGLLLDEMRRDGYAVESYQFPLIVDERRSRSTLLQRALGFIDIKTDREVLMLYRTLLPPPLGEWLVDVFGPEADAVAVGITGGGVEFVLEGTGGRLLSLEQLLLDLRRAARYTPQLYVFSLEGCIERDLLTPLCAADLTPSAAPARFNVGGHLLRASLRALLRAEPVYDRLHGR